MTNFASAKSNPQSVNAELIASWQFRTTFCNEQTIAYTEVDNYYFYSDNTYLKESNSDECVDLNEDKKTNTLRWKIIGNNIVLLNDKGKQTAIFCVKGNVKDMFKGQKNIVQIKQSYKQYYNKNNDGQLAINQ
jgi:hypothetical protein